ncbi:hypothetical protein [Streptomyces sp. NPDC059224]|uniref:hypothetical protein n=1 Tax=Streptomyces sp. NPDC059224 TaxID=3346775 RepID=UPI0036AB78DE
MDDGAVPVVTTELSRERTATARRTFAETGLDDLITVLEGDARDSLAGLDAPVGLVLPDGWRDLCLPVPKTLEPRLATGTPVVGDSSFASTRPCPDHVGARSRCGPPARKSARRRRRAAILHR